MKIATHGIEKFKGAWEATGQNVLHLGFSYFVYKHKIFEETPNCFESAAIFSLSLFGQRGLESSQCAVVIHTRSLLTVVEFRIKISSTGATKSQTLSHAFEEDEFVIIFRS